jgi:hypothetical protein
MLYHKLSRLGVPEPASLVNQSNEPQGKPPMTDTMTIPRLYTDDSRDSRFDTYDVTMALHDHAPSAAPFLMTEPEAAIKYILFRIPPRWNGSHVFEEHRR